MASSVQLKTCLNEIAIELGKQKQIKTKKQKANINFDILTLLIFAIAMLGSQLPSRVNNNSFLNFVPEPWCISMVGELRNLWLESAISAEASGRT
jgi:hypothetical protein